MEKFSCDRNNSIKDKFYVTLWYHISLWG